MFKVLLSHAHMDHLDFATLRALPGRPAAVTAHATEDLLRGTRLSNPIPLDWVIERGYQLGMVTWRSVPSRSNTGALAGNMTSFAATTVTGWRERERS
jgi:L-ascorbate metabolism protein UlaG (beta-lactamase superfamily)